MNLTLFDGGLVPTATQAALNNWLLHPWKLLSGNMCIANIVAPEISTSPSKHPSLFWISTGRMSC